MMDSPVTEEGLPEKIPQWHQLRKATSFHVEKHEGDNIQEYEPDSPDESGEFASPLGYQAHTNLTVAGNFITSKRRSSVHGVVTWPGRLAMMTLKHPAVMNSMGLLTLFDAFLTCAAIDARAAGVEQPLWQRVATTSCLGVYTAEFVVWCLVRHFSVFTDKFLVLDLFVITTGYAEIIANLYSASRMDALNFLRFLRIARIFRLLKVFRKIGYLKELRKLVMMATTCLKTLIWSFIFCFLIMSVWAMLMVELVYPLILDLHERTGTFANCEQCQRAASSVMSANLLLFKTVIAGDSWGLIAVPVIEEFPATAIIFVGSQLTLVFGVLNLIVAVVVDTFAELRDRDILNRAEEMEQEIEQDKKFLQKIFERADEDGSGELTLEELKEGAKKDPEFQSRLRVMDIDETDLQQLFQMIDTDGSGAVEAEEFIQPLSRWVHESKTANRFIKYNVMRSLRQNEELWNYSQTKFDQLNSHMSRIATSLGVQLDHRRPSRHKRNSTKSLRSSLGTSEDKAEKAEKEHLNNVYRHHKHRHQHAVEAGRSISDRLIALEEQQKRLVSSLTSSDPELAARSGSSLLQDPTQSISVASGSGDFMGKSWSLRSDLRGGEQVAKAKEAESPPAPALGHVDLDKAEAKHALKILKANKSEVEGVIDFSGLKDVSKLKRKWQGSSLDVGAGSGDEEEQAVSREGSLFRQTNRSSIIELDSMLQGAMETVEHLLLDATAAACVRVEYVLRMRLQGLAAQGTEVNSPDSPASPKSAKSETSELPQRSQKKCFESVTSPGPSLPRAQPVELEVLNDSGQLPAPPPHQRLRSLDEPPGGPRPLGI